MPTFVSLVYVGEEPLTAAGCAIGAGRTDESGEPAGAIINPPPIPWRSVTGAAMIADRNIRC